MRKSGEMIGFNYIFFCRQGESEEALCSIKGLFDHGLGNSVIAY